MTKPTPCKHKTISESSLDGKMLQRNCVDCGKDFMPTPCKHEWYQDRRTNGDFILVCRNCMEVKPTPEEKGPVQTMIEVTERFKDWPAPDARVDWEKSKNDIAQKAMDELFDSDHRISKKTWDIVLVAVQAAFEKGRGK